jgi:hypothetical protein
MSDDAHREALRALEASCTLFQAVDVVVGHVDGHAHSIALMIRGDVRHLIQRIQYLAEVVGAPAPAVKKAKEVNEVD